MNTLRHLLIVACAGAVLASCGLKGPLKLPRKPTTTPTTTIPPQPAPSPAPQS